MLPIQILLKSSLTYFILVFSIGFLCGAVRVPFLQPLLGDRHAQLVETPVMFMAIWKSAHFIVEQLHTPNFWTKDAIPTSALERLSIGLLATIMLLIVEAVGSSWTKGWSGVVEWVRDRDPIAGAFYFALVGIFFVAPSLITL